MITPRQEALWVLRAQCNDREALESLLRSVQPSLHGYLRTIVGADNADDVLQDVLLLIYRKLAGLENPEVFRPWAFRIASRVAFRRLKKQKLWEEELTGAPLEETAAGDAPIAADAVRRLVDMNSVSPASRAVLILHFQEELPLGDVAAILEIPLGTVKSRLAYGLAVLRKQLHDKRSL